MSIINKQLNKKNLLFSPRQEHFLARAQFCIKYLEAMHHLTHPSKQTAYDFPCLTFTHRRSLTFPVLRRV